MPVFCLLAGCGFHPIYGARDDNSSVAAELNQVAVENIPDRPGQMLRNGLIDRMYGKGRPRNPKYHLEISLNWTEEGIGLLPDATTSLTELNLNADYYLKDDTGKVLMHAVAHAVANYNQLEEQLGTVAARDNAYQRSLNMIANEIVIRLGLFFSEGAALPKPKPAPPP
ncbi:MAG: LPS assembly lipoprotein LptE [Bdellovibrionales bacterium]